MVVVAGFAQFSDGTSVPLLDTGAANGTLSELKTNAAFTVSAQGLGSYAVGKTLISLMTYATNSMDYCYLLRQGLPIFFGSVASAGVISYGNKQFPKSVTLEAGDTVQVMPATATARITCMVAHCSDGTQRSFSATSTGAGTYSLVDDVTGNKIGETLQGKRIVMAYAKSPEGIKMTSGGVVILNAQGAVVGVIEAGNPIAEQVCFSPMNTAIGLNFDAQIVTTT